MATQRDWELLRDSMIWLDSKVQNGVLVAGAEQWKLPAQITPESAGDYLEAAKQRLQEVTGAVEKAMDSPLERLKNAGREVGNVAKQAIEQAKKLAQAAGVSISQEWDDMHNTLKEIPMGLGIGAGVAIIIALLLLRELKG